MKRLLGDLEAEIMELLWDLGEAKVRDVHASIQKQRELAYTTVMTVMGRLAEKGLLDRREEGRAMIYTPALSREEFLNDAASAILTGLFRDFATPAMSQLVRMMDDESDERIEELARLIEKRRSEK